VKVIRTKTFLRAYHEAPQLRQRQLEKQLGFLLQNFRHPSLHTKIYDKKRRIWQARMNGGWRFYFQIKGDTIYLLTITPHPK